MFLRRGIATLALTVLGFGAGAAFTSQASAQNVNQTGQNGAMTQELRGERGSKRDIAFVERRLRRVIADLNRDQRDYGGHRASAVNLLNQAEGELQQALQFDRAHPNQ